MRKAIWLIVALAFILGASAGAALAAPKYVWKLSHVRPQGTTIDKDVHWFADKVFEDSKGQIKIEIYPASQLGDYTVVHERISVGAIEMACQPPGVAADRRIQILNLPYMVATWEQAKKVYASGSPLMNTAAELFAKQDIKYLAAYPVYFGGIALNVEPVAPGDPDVKKGIKVRVPPLKSFQLLANAMGYQATPIPFSEAFTAIQTGIVDGIIGSGAEGYYANFRDVIKYYIPANTHFEQWYLYMNMEAFNKLPKDLQEVVLNAAKEFEARRMVQAEKDQAANEQRLADYGITIVPLSDEELNNIAKKVRAEVWPEIKKDLGEEWADSVLKNIVE
ncbi:Extracellular solute-binding protein, family 7 [Thermovirga lienii DSM 17291]|jgi:TRAP-type C4-dicarboxylate transport system substrate-binding protein|uniref:Extracellular solute-binding protein, family 7 n=1 Tax=Thermovirga lienii (strain ATCC BAA-1197 / DSM 17291 / Cas60314) TaxID=580340 RepID=G7V7B2_THELD|nr:TRAP transporter substrate-binding protein DctP [Thermovirga lienii]AER67228.1 Extracellular solute-binding protein, family 7 [Thermovirga lienii DSM 17291]MDN5319206.1 TRAP-type transport system periplasmic protein [Thermovirga sp.]MDN5368396.1 TRAP-type transport system periplasmic protein [Thermovirga sp.]HCD72114.1 C4-dicarboxylate ABC transporter [Thermovirga lienii]